MCAYLCVCVCVCVCVWERERERASHVCVCVCDIVVCVCGHRKRERYILIYYNNVTLLYAISPITKQEHNTVKRNFHEHTHTHICMHARTHALTHTHTHTHTHTIILTALLASHTGIQPWNWLITNDDNNLAVLRVITSGIYYGDGGEKRRVYNGGRALTLWYSLTEFMLKHFSGSCPICLTVNNLSPLETSFQNVSHLKIQTHKRFNRIRTKKTICKFSG